MDQIPILSLAKKLLDFAGDFDMFPPIFPVCPCPVSTFHPPSVCPSLVGAFVSASLATVEDFTTKTIGTSAAKRCKTDGFHEIMGFHEVTVMVLPEMGCCTK